MRTLSIRQPWAWLIVSGLKDIENRDWETLYRGRVLVHAGVTMPRRYYDEVQQWVGDEFNIQLPEPELLERGGIVGLATIAGCVRESESRWFNPGGFGFQMRDARPLPFYPCKGQLKFFDVPASAVGVTS
jgi:hypothetical protein